jgi:hypothetical protein
MSPNFNLFNSTTQIPEDSNMHDQDFLMCAIRQKENLRCLLATNTCDR